MSRGCHTQEEARPALDGADLTLAGVSGYGLYLLTLARLSLDTGPYLLTPVRFSGYGRICYAGPLSPDTAHICLRWPIVSGIRPYLLMLARCLWIRPYLLTLAHCLWIRPYLLMLAIVSGSGRVSAYAGSSSWIWSVSVRLRGCFYPSPFLVRYRLCARVLSRTGRGAICPRPQDEDSGGYEDDAQDSLRRNGAARNNPFYRGRGLGPRQCRPAPRSRSSALRLDQVRPVTLNTARIDH